MAVSTLKLLFRPSGMSRSVIGNLILTVKDSGKVNINSSCNLRNIKFEFYMYDMSQKKFPHIFFKVKGFKSEFSV